MEIEAEATVDCVCPHCQCEFTMDTWVVVDIEPRNYRDELEESEDLMGGV